jgi:putative ABC transport system permease protein
MTRFYRMALRLLPRLTRAQHGEQMAAVFDDQVGDTRRRRGRLATVRLLAIELWALLRFAWCDRRGATTPTRIDERQFSWTLQPDRTTSMLTASAQDLRYAARLLARSPGFALVAIATMALAIGANTAVFSVVNGVLLKALPFDDPDRVVVLGHYTSGGEDLDSTTPGNLYDWMRGVTAFEAMAGFSPTERIVTHRGNAERIRGGLSVGSIFAVLGRPAAEGRTLSVADDDPGAAPVIVLGSRLARRLFGESSSIGQSLAINGIPHTVVGVMPPDFAFLDYDYEYWIPARFDAAFRSNRDQFFLAGVARLAPDTTLAQATAQLNVVTDAIRRDHPQFTQNVVAAVVPVKTVLLDGVETRFLVLMGAVTFVLLIACANLGNLLLARASTRRREMAVRHALGAGHGRLVRQMLAESLLLGLLGGVAGLVLGLAMLQVLLALLPDDLPRLKGVEVDAIVLLYTFAVAAIAGLVFGTFPVLQLATRPPMPAMRDGARGSARAGLMRNGLVSSEVALALMLLVGAGLLVRSFTHLLEVRPGFATERLLTFTASVPTAVYGTPSERLAFFETAAGQLESIPGVRAVTMATTLPVTGRGSGAWFNIVDRPLPPNETPPGVPNRFVRANYFQVMGVALRRGRFFDDGDRPGGTRAVIISESVARRFFADVDPIGRRIYMGAPDNRVVAESTIVGVVADVKQTGLAEAESEAVYIPHVMTPAISSLTFAVRTSIPPASVAPVVRDVMRRLDPGVPIVRLQTMDDILGRATWPARSSMVLLSLFAGIALTLAIIGVFGVLSYTVNQQTTEIGIRMALGASRRDVTVLILGQGLAPVLVGLAVGGVGALALTRFMETLLFGVTPTDAPTFGAVVALLAVTAIAAAYIPTRRATRVDPVRALRQD